MEDYYRKFGIGSKTPVGFPGESAGLLAGAKDWVSTRRYTILFGQGYSVTAIQQAGVFQTIANKGVGVPPSLVEGTVNDSGTLIPSTPHDAAPGRHRGHRDEAVADDGGGHRRERHRERGPHQGLPRRRQDRHGRPLRRQARRYNGFTASFIGFAPAEAPKYVVAVFIQKPSAGMFGGALAGPVFNQVMSYLLERTGAPPSPTSTLDYHVWADKPLVVRRPRGHQRCAGEAGWPVSWDDVVAACPGAGAASGRRSCATSTAGSASRDRATGARQGPGRR